MKNRSFALVSLLLMGGVAAMAQNASQPGASPAAQSAAARAVATKVAIIQAQSALLGTKEGQKALEEMNKKLEPIKVALDKKATEVRDLQDKLQRGGNAMADAAKVALQNDINTRTKAYNRDMEDAQATAEDEQRKMLDELTGKMQRVIQEYATAHAYTLILDVTNPQTPVLWSAPENDITSDVIALYDKMYPSTGASAPQTAPSKPATTLPKPPASTPPVTKKQP